MSSPSEDSFSSGEKRAIRWWSREGICKPHSYTGLAFVPRTGKMDLLEPALREMQTFEISNVCISRETTRFTMNFPFILNFLILNLSILNLVSSILQSAYQRYKNLVSSVKLVFAVFFCSNFCHIWWQLSVLYPDWRLRTTSHKWRFCGDFNLGVSTLLVVHCPLWNLLSPHFVSTVQPQPLLGGPWEICDRILWVKIFQR